MRKLSLFVCLISFFSCVGTGQIDIENLKGTWSPVLQQYSDGDTSQYELPGFLLTFLDENRGMTEYSGTTISRAFTYIQRQDTLLIKYEDIENDTVFIEQLDNSRMKLFFGPYDILSFIPLPKFHSGKAIESIRNELEQDTWVVHYKTPDEYESEYKLRFENFLADSAIVNPAFHDQIKNAQIYIDWSGDHEIFWKLGEHQKTQVLRIDAGLSSSWFEGTFFLKNFQKDKLELVSWSYGEQYELILEKEKKLTTKQQAKFLRNLTNQKWHIDKEIIPPPIDTTGLIDIGMIPIDFEELEEFGLPPYLHDSTLLLNQKDIDEKLLILEFNNQGEYKIYRESRLLDEGTWTMLFNFTVIKLESNRSERSDGLLGGFIEVENLNKNQFKIRRIFEGRLDKTQTEDRSFVEIYRPIK